MNLKPRFSDRVLLVGAIVALTTAATLVAYLEHNADELQRQQNGVIIRQICDRTVTVLAGRIRHLLDIAVLETIEGIGHQKIADEDVPRVAAAFARGVKRHPYVDRFFLWSAHRTAQIPDQVVFFSPAIDGEDDATPIVARDGTRIGSLLSQPTLGREILRLAQAVSGPRTFLVVDRVVDGVPYEIVVHLLWRDDRRVELFSVIGYTVNLRNVNAAMLHRLLDEEIDPFLNPDPQSPRLAVALKDERARLVYGNPVPEGAPAATASLDMLFFPGEPLTAWLAGKLPPRPWQIIVSTAQPLPDRRVYGRWVVPAVVLLIMIAVVCGVTVDRQARKLSQMQADFVANVSHQLKTPLSLLSAAIETLWLGRVPADKQRQYLDILSSQTTRMTALVERILHFSRLDADAKSYRMEPVDLVPLVRTIVDRFTVDGRQQVPIEFAADASSAIVRGDASAIEQAVVNLLENAVKYGGDRNTVQVRVERNGARVTISVRDRGLGIHSSDLPYVFDKFYRGRTGDHGRSGFGLGLALVRSVARAHGGVATVHTEYNNGSEFIIVLPLLAPQDGHAVPHPRH